MTSHIKWGATDVGKRDEPPECKGLFYRYRESVFVAGRGLKFTRELYPLKRMSCPGCAQCVGIVETFIECGAGSVEISDALSDGDTARLSIVVDSWDGEYADDWHVVAERSDGPQ